MENYKSKVECDEQELFEIETRVKQKCWKLCGEYSNGAESRDREKLPSYLESIKLNYI